ncbi:MAG: hypothetical protein MKZ95_16785 [Pirellulales bacterium]|nr:hypothetical protein [Pirellulales bacterium]
MKFRYFLDGLSNLFRIFGVLFAVEKFFELLAIGITVFLFLALMAEITFGFQDGLCKSSGLLCLAINFVNAIKLYLEILDGQSRLR